MKKLIIKQLPIPDSSGDFFWKFYKIQVPSEPEFFETYNKLLDWIENNSHLITYNQWSCSNPESVVNRHILTFERDNDLKFLEEFKDYIEFPIWNNYSIVD